MPHRLTASDVIERGRSSVLGPDELLPGAVDVVSGIQAEAVWEDGARLAAVVDLFGPGSESRRLTVLPTSSIPPRVNDLVPSLD